MKYCKRCGLITQEDMRTCPSCGNKLIDYRPDSPSSIKKWILPLCAVIIVATACIVGLLIANNTDAPSTHLDATEDLEYLDTAAHCAELEVQQGIEAVITYLADKHDPKYQDLKAKYTLQFESYILSKVDELVSQHQYPAALDVLENAIAIYDSSRFKGAITDTKEQYARCALLAAGHQHTAVLNFDGTVSATGNNKDGQCNVSTWSDIIAVGAGDYFTVGLKNDGHVLVTGSNMYGQCDVSGWSNIVAIGVGDYHVIGLRDDGTLEAAGFNDNGQCDINSLYAQAAGRKIVDLAAGHNHTVALLDDGTVIAVGSNDHGQLNLDTWSDIVAVDCGSEHVVGLRSDGTVVAAGLGNEGQCDVYGWENILKVVAGDYATFGITEDGDVLAIGTYHITKESHPIPQVDTWTGILDIACGTGHAIAITEDGTSFFDGRFSET